MTDGIHPESELGRWRERIEKAASDKADAEERLKERFPAPRIETLWLEPHGTMYKLHEGNNMILLTASELVGLGRMLVEITGPPKEETTELPLGVVRLRIYGECETGTFEVLGYDKKSTSGNWAIGRDGNGGACAVTLWTHAEITAVFLRRLDEPQTEKGD